MPNPNASPTNQLDRSAQLRLATREPQKPTGLHYQAAPFATQAAHKGETTVKWKDNCCLIQNLIISKCMKSVNANVTSFAALEVAASVVLVVDDLAQNQMSKWASWYHITEWIQNSWSFFFSWSTDDPSKLIEQQAHVAIVWKLVPSQLGIPNKAKQQVQIDSNWITKSFNMI